MELSGRTALVTGASRGIGLAIASRLARSGFKVGIAARTADDVDAAAVSLNASGARVLAVAADVRDPRSVSAAVDATEDALGPINLLVNNAGTAGPAGPEWHVDGDAWWECVETSVRGAFNCTRAVLPGMIRRRSGRIIEVVSVTATAPWPLASATSIAKTALLRHAEGLAASCSAHGVSVFAIHPGMVRTTLLLSYRTDPTLATYLDTVDDDAYSSPDVAAELVARIATGELDALAGRFLDATSDIDQLLPPVHLGADALTLRVRTPLVPASESARPQPDGHFTSRPGKQRPSGHEYTTHQRA